MFRVRILVGMLALGVLTSGWLMGDDVKKADDLKKAADEKKAEDKKADDKKTDEKQDPPVRLRGQLPAGWKRLGLDETQVQKIYKIQNDTDAKIAVLEQQIKELKKEEKKLMEAVLTDAQKARLKELKDDK
jgi:hypothetical protein